MKKKFWLFLVGLLVCASILCLASCSKKTYTVTTNQTIEEAGTITAYDEEVFERGDEVTVTAKTNHITYKWLGWYSDDKLLSKDLSYSFEIKENMNLTAKWEFDQNFLAFEYTIEGDTCTIHKIKNKNAMSAVIPEGVTKVERVAFLDCKKLESVVIPDTVTEIGEQAFFGCSSLKSIDIPDSVTSLGKNVFRGCSALESLALPKAENKRYFGDLFGSSGIPVLSLTIRHGEIDPNGFKDASYLKSLTIGRGVTAVGDHAFGGNYRLKSVIWECASQEIQASMFFGCGNLESVVITEGVEMIGGAAFRECNSLTSIDLPKSLTTIGNWTFSGCDSLESIDLPDGVTDIGMFAFGDCKSLKSIELPEGLTYVKDNMFDGCESLGIVKFGSKVQRIGWSAFSSCAFESFVIPEGVTELGRGAFEDCQNLTTVVIASSVTKIGSGAFRNCNALSSVTMKNPSGWALEEPKQNTKINADLSNAKTAATCLVTTMGGVDWVRQ